MRLTPRLIPLVIAVTGLTALFRVGILWHDAGEAFAEGTAKPAPAAAAGETPTPPPAAAAGTTSAAAGEQPAGAEPVKPKPQQKFSPQEVELLQNLSKRRAEIEQRADELDRRELLLKAAEQRVDEKIARLQQLQTQIDASISKAQEQDDERIKSLVHIYETMKPKEAATIFEGMEMPALLQLLTRMKDLKTAPILAAMAPDKARAVTIAMAQHKDLPDPKTN